VQGAIEVMLVCEIELFAIGTVDDVHHVMIAIMISFRPAV
jgi:hypothetical protein